MISLLLSLLLFVVKRRCSCGVKQRTVVKVEILRSNERRQGQVPYICALWAAPSDRPQLEPNAPVRDL